MNDTKRPRLTGHSRPKAALSSRLGEALMRRRGTPAVSPGKDFRADDVTDIDDDAQPLTDLLGKVRAQSRPARQTEYLHVSDLLGKCIRRFSIMQRLDLPPKPQTITLTDLVTYAQGDATHDVIKAQAVLADPKLVWGRWKCRCGRTVTPEPSLLSEVDPERACPNCRSPLVHYEEVPMQDEELGIVGTPDLILYIPSARALHVSELKSIAHDRWKELVRPLPDHVLQVLFYWHLMKRKGYALTSRASIGYITKGWQFSGSPLKEFTFDAQSQLHRLEPHIADAKAFHEAKNGGKLPARICASDRSPEARQCNVCQQCFGGIDEITPVKISVADALGSRPRAPRSRD